MKILPIIKKTLPLIMLMVIISSCSPARRSISIEEGWDLLDERKVNFVRDKDVIDVHTTNKFTAIRFKVEVKEIRINELKIHYQNGDKLEPSIDDIIAAGQYSKVIELSQDGKFVNRIEFRYRTTGNVLEGRANVLVFGKRYLGN